MPLKPWQVAPSTSSATPLGASNANDGQTKPWQTGATTTAGDSMLTTSAERPWRDGANPADASATTAVAGPYTTANAFQTSDNPYGTHSDPFGQPMYGRPMYGTSSYGTSYGAAPYGSSYGAYGGAYGSSYGGMYGNTSSMNGNGMYGNSMYSSPYRGGVGYGYGGYGGAGYGTGGFGGYGTGGFGGYGGYGTPGIPPGMPAPGQPQGPPGQPGNLLEGAKSKWQIFMQSLHNLMHFFGRISFLMDENAHAVHFFITALLQMLDKASFLWGEVARFVLRVLGYKLPLGRKGSSRNIEKPADAKAGDVAQGTSAVAALESVWAGK